MMLIGEGFSFYILDMSGRTRSYSCADLGGLPRYDEAAGVMRSPGGDAAGLPTLGPGPGTSSRRIRGRDGLSMTPMKPRLLSLA